MRPRLLLLVALLSLAAPAALRAALGPRYGGQLRVALLDLPARAEPALPAGPAEALLQSLVHETLVGLGPEGLPTPGLARRWSSAAGGREWTLFLGAGLRFHDDRPLTAEDAVRSLRRFLRGRSAAAERLAESLEGGEDFRARRREELPGLAAPEPDRVVLRLVAPRALPLAPLASPAAAVVSPSGAGAGPFVPTLLVPGQRAALNAFAGHLRGRPYLDELELLVLPERAALKPALQSGEVDLVAGDGALGAPAQVLLLVLDPTRPPFREPGARAAAAARLDRADLARHLLSAAQPAAALLPPSLLPPLGASPALAGTPLEGRGATLTVARDVPPLASQRVVAQLGELGLALRVLPETPARARAAASEARLLLFSPEVPEPELALAELAGLVSTPPGAHATLQDAAAERDFDRRRALLHRAEAELRGDLALVPLAFVPAAAAARPGLHGLFTDPAGRLRLEDAWREPR